MKESEWHEAEARNFSLTAKLAVAAMISAMIVGDVLAVIFWNILPVTVPILHQVIVLALYDLIMLAGMGAFIFFAVRFYREDKEDQKLAQEREAAMDLREKSETETATRK